MRCKVKGCMITTRQASKYKCWVEHGICFKHAIELHSEIYNKKFTTDRKFLNVVKTRGRNHRFQSP